MLKSLIKQTAAGVLYHTGVLDRVNRPPLTVLGYHRVLEGRLEETTTCPLGMVVGTKMFEEQLAHAARQYRMVSLDEIRDACESGKPLPQRAGFVTFDDGWRDNYTLAFPILRRMGIPAAVFVTTDYMGTQKSFWFTRLMQSALSDGGRNLRRGVARSSGWPEDVSGELDRVAAQAKPLWPWHLDQLIEMLKRYPEAEIDNWVVALASNLNGSGKSANGESFFLTWDQLREMDRAEFRVGSHTCSHKILTQISNEDAQEELRRSKEKLETELGHPVDTFAYPNGDYEARHMQMAWEAGYRVFFVNSRPRPGGPEGRVFARPCVHERVSWGAGGRFSPSLFEFHLSGASEQVWKILGR